MGHFDKCIQKKSLKFFVKSLKCQRKKGRNILYPTLRNTFDALPEVLQSIQEETANEPLMIALATHADRKWSQKSLIIPG